MKFWKTIKNIAAASVSQIVTLAVAFLLPRLYIVSYGSEVNGLLTSISQIFGYFALLEAGVGAATQQALYKYVSNQRKDKINGVLAATKHFYTRTGALYALLVIIVSFVYPLIVPINLDYMMVASTIILIGSGSVINFWFQGKYRIFLTAEGKDYINSNVSVIATTATNIIKITLLIAGFSIVEIQIGYLLLSVAQAVFYTIYIKKNYGWIDFKVKPAFEEISQSRSVLVHQITSLVFNNTDVLLLTFIVRDLRLVSLYTVYGLIYNNIDNITAMVHSAYQPLLGQLYYENRTRFKDVFECSESFYMAFSFSLYFVAFALTPGFIGLYTNGADMSYSDMWVPLLFVLMKLLAQLRRPLMGIINLAGDFKNTQSRTIAEMLINIITSLILVKWLSIYGLLIGTIVALLYRCIDVLIYVPKKLIDHNPAKTLLRWGTYSITFVVGIALLNLIEVTIDSWMMFFIAGILTMILAIVLFGVVSIYINKQEAKFVFSIFKYRFRNSISKRESYNEKNTYS